VSAAHAAMTEPWVLLEHAPATRVRRVLPNGLKPLEGLGLVLDILEQRGARTVADVAREALVDESAARRHLRTACRRGLAVRSRPVANGPFVYRPTNDPRPPSEIRRRCGT
jgi:predicted transcriptional regulator